MNWRIRALNTTCVVGAEACLGLCGADYNVKAEEAAGVALLGSKTIARYLQTELLAVQAASA